MDLRWQILTEHQLNNWCSPYVWSLIHSKAALQLEFHLGQEWGVCCGQTLWITANLCAKSAGLHLKSKQLVLRCCPLFTQLAIILTIHLDFYRWLPHESGLAMYSIAHSIAHFITHLFKLYCLLKWPILVFLYLQKRYVTSASKTLTDLRSHQSCTSDQNYTRLKTFAPVMSWHLYASTTKSGIDLLRVCWMTPRHKPTFPTALSMSVKGHMFINIKSSSRDILYLM